MSISPLPLTYSTHSIPRSAGAPPLIYYVVEPAGQHSPQPQALWHIILQGSGIDSMSPALFEAQKKSKHVLTTELVAAGAPVVLIEKPGVTAEGCDTVILHAYNTIDHRVQDLCAVVAHLQSIEPQRSFVLIGASEGAEVMLRAAAHLPQPRALVLIAWLTEQSPMDMTASYLLQKHIRPVAWPLMRPFISWYVNRAARKIAANPDATDHFFLKNSYRYWTSFIQQDPKRIQRCAHIPLCVIHGANDLIVMHSEDIMRELQLTSTAPVAWLRYANAAHRLDMNLVARDVIRWLQKNKEMNY